MTTSCNYYESRAYQSANYHPPTYCQTTVSRFKNHHFQAFSPNKSKKIHPGRLTWNIIIEVSKIIFLSKWVICMFHINLPGCEPQMQIRTKVSRSIFPCNLNSWLEKSLLEQCIKSHEIGFPSHFAIFQAIVDVATCHQMGWLLGAMKPFTQETWDYQQQHQHQLLIYSRMGNTYGYPQVSRCFFKQTRPWNLPIETTTTTTTAAATTKTTSNHQQPTTSKLLATANLPTSGKQYPATISHQNASRNTQPLFLWGQMSMNKAQHDKIQVWQMTNFAPNEESKRVDQDEYPKWPEKMIYKLMYIDVMDPMIPGSIDFTATNLSRLDKKKIQKDKYCWWFRHPIPNHFGMVLKTL